MNLWLKVAFIYTIAYRYILQGGTILRKTLLVGITIGIAIWIIAPVNYVSSSTRVEVDEVIGSAITTNSYRMNISGQKFWFSIKITFLVPTNITIEYNRYILCDHKTRVYFSRLWNSQNSYTYGMSRSGYYSSDADYYYQINLGEINRSFYHSKQKYYEWETRRHTKLGPSYNRTGTHYHTFFSYSDCKESTMEIWINTSHNISISTTQGTEVFFFDREDFYGNINMGCRRGTFILNGVKEIDINDSMFAWFKPDGEATGFEVLEYKSPTGDHKRRTQVDIRGEPFNLNHSEVWDFNEGLWWASKGKWTFKTTMMKIGLEKFYPTVFLFGADIKLPE